MSAASPSSLFSLQKQKNDIKSLTPSPVLSSVQKPTNTLPPTSTKSPFLFSKQNEGSEHVKKTALLSSPPSVMFQCPRIVEGTFYQSNGGVYTPAISYPPPVEIQEPAKLFLGPNPAVLSVARTLARQLADLHQTF